MLSCFGTAFPDQGAVRRLPFRAVMAFASIIFIISSAAPLHAAPPPVQHVAPNEVGMSIDSLDRIRKIVDESIGNGDIPGCVVLIAHHGKIAFHEAYGHRQLKPVKLPMKKDTVFDMASVTKPVATATSVMLLAERGQLRLNDKFGRYIDSFNQSGKKDVTIFQMLTHQAGFVPDSPLREYADPNTIWPNLWNLGLEYEPTTKFVYSDVGFQMLGKLVEIRSDLTLDQFARRNIFEPLGMTETGFLPDASLRERAATTERREGRWMVGEVHDPRSYAMGGIAGHAGLFSTAEDLARYAIMILGEGEYAGTRVLSPQTVRTMKTPHTIAGTSQRALGWDVRSRYSTNRGELMTDQAIGHGGFTGNAMWIDSGLDLAVVFLSNRVHPDGKGSANHLAGRIASIAAAAVNSQHAAAQMPSKMPSKMPVIVSPTTEQKGGPLHSSSAPVMPGIDVLLGQQFASLAGQRLGLITNHTGVSRHGHRTVDLIHESEVADLRLIFSPEHGIQGILDAKIADARDEKTGLPVYSLYGTDDASRTPSRAALDQIDTIVFDIQDIGTRFYTYISTMLNAMRAAAESGKRVVILDRPNPLGGLVVSGPVLDDGKQSFVGCHPIAVQHGMTVGELATMFQLELADELGELDLHIVEVANWPRNMLWDATGLTWINPSPNMRSWNEALLYPGIGLLETTNLSVGRGTDRPFEIVGAPYIQPGEFAAALNATDLPGLRFIPRYITPSSSKFKEERCGAVDIVITHRGQVDAVNAGLKIAVTLRKLYPDAWKMTNFDRLLGDDTVYSLVSEGKQLEVIADSYQDELKKFRKRRKICLLYR